MFDRLDKNEKEQYINLMEEMKALNCTVQQLGKRRQLGIKELIKLRLKNGKSYKFEEKPLVPHIRDNANYFSEHRVAVYTCIIGAYDEILEPVFIPDNCDYYIITDQEVPVNSAWKKVDISGVEEITEMTSPTMINRYFKMNPYQIFKNYKYSIYIDGNLKIYTDPTEYVNKIGEYGIAFFDHGVRKCVYDEIQTCVELKKAPEEKLRAFETYLKQQDMPEKYGLLYGGTIVRDHESELGRSISQEWWNAFLQFPMRDQILLPLVLFRKKIAVSKLATLGQSLKGAHGIERCKHK